jgi:hypothetical protein
MGCSVSEVLAASIIRAMIALIVGKLLPDFTALQPEDSHPRKSNVRSVSFRKKCFATEHVGESIMTRKLPCSSLAKVNGYPD